MDRVIYTALSGAKQLMRRQEMYAQNLANVSTTGYRALQDAAEAVAVDGPGLPTRSFAAERGVGADLTPGPVANTGRSLDVAIAGSGFLTVEGNDGTEGYTRAGHFEVGADGLLKTPAGLNVIGEGGPITIPPDSRVDIASDGSVSASRPDNPKQQAIVGRLKLVDPPADQLVRSRDGLFRMGDATSAPASDTVKLVPSALEGSNVSAVGTMVGMITLARQFDLQMKMLENVQANDRAATQILSINA